MDIKELMEDRIKKPKEKTGIMSGWILDHPGYLDTVLEYAAGARDPVKATCIEAIESATKARPDIATKDCFAFAAAHLSAKAPRIKWESAKVIANTAHLYPNEIKKILPALLTNTEHNGTVVRWSAAFALAAILKAGGSVNKELVPAVETICRNEEKNSIRKIYIQALKEAGEMNSNSKLKSKK